MDLLDDPFCEPKIVAKAPIASKFQPKAKPRPKKPPPAAVKPTKALPAASVVQDKVSNQSVKPNVVAENKTDGMSSACIADTEDGSLSAKAKEVSGSSVVEQSEMDLSGPIRGTNLSADSSLGSKLPSDVIGLSRTTPDQAIEISNPDESNVHSEEEPPVESNVSFASASPLRPCNSQAALDQSKDKTLQESDHFEQSVCGDGDGDFQIDVEQLGAGDFSCLDTMEILTEGPAALERRAVKLMPKPKAQVDRKKDLAALVSHGLELPSENQNIVMDGSIHAGDPDTVSDNLHMRVDGNISLDHSLYQSDNVVFEDTDSMMPEKSPQQSGEIHGEKNSYDALLSSAKSVDEAFLSGFQENENGYEDGVNDEFHDNSNSPDKARDKSVSNRDKNNDCDKLGEEILQKKKPRKAKKAVSENDKPTRKRKKADQKPDETIEKPPKKFPRGTRRKRCVDKTLLEAPEDELDLQRVPIKDLIILAEHKERQAKKEAAAAPAPETNERIDNSEDFRYDYDETYGSDQDRDAIDEPSTSEVLKDTGYYNYQSLMTKAPRARWTKHDTELFYQGISQFGSDLSMVQQLFPGRTRHQIKLKYKKEERQNPMRLHDALTSRSPNLSHFKLVIERLQAAQEAEADNEDSVCPTGEDEGQEEVLNTHEDGAESKKEEGPAADQEPDRPQVESPPESYHSKEEEFDWMEYESEL